MQLDISQKKRSFAGRYKACCYGDSMLSDIARQIAMVAVYGTERSNKNKKNERGTFIYSIDRIYSTYGIRLLIAACYMSNLCSTMFPCRLLWRLYDAHRCPCCYDDRILHSMVVQVGHLRPP